MMGPYPPLSSTRASESPPPPPQPATAVSLNPDQLPAPPSFQDSDCLSAPLQLTGEASAAGEGEPSRGRPLGLDEREFAAESILELWGVKGAQDQSAGPHDDQQSHQPHPRHRRCDISHLLGPLG